MSVPAWAAELPATSNRPRRRETRTIDCASDVSPWFCFDRPSPTSRVAGESVCKPGAKPLARSHASPPQPSEIQAEMRGSRRADAASDRTGLSGEARSTGREISFPQAQPRRSPASREVTAAILARATILQNRSLWQARGQPVRCRVRSGGAPLAEDLSLASSRTRSASGGAPVGRCWAGCGRLVAGARVRRRRRSRATPRRDPRAPGRRQGGRDPRPSSRSSASRYADNAELNYRLGLAMVAVGSSHRGGVPAAQGGGVGRVRRAGGHPAGLDAREHEQPRRGAARRGPRARARAGARGGAAAARHLGGAAPRRRDRARVGGSAGGEGARQPELQLRARLGARRGRASRRRGGACTASCSTPTGRTSRRAGARRAAATRASCSRSARTRIAPSAR